MSWTGIDHQGEVTADAVFKAIGDVRKDDVVDSAMFKDYVFVAGKADADGIEGSVLFFMERDGMLFVKPISESMGIPVVVPTGPEARRVAAQLTKGEFADMRWRAAIFS